MRDTEIEPKETRSGAPTPTPSTSSKREQPISPSISPSSPESDIQSGSVTGGPSSGMATITEMSYLNDDPIPPPSPFDQPSSSREFTIKVSLFSYLLSLI